MLNYRNFAFFFCETQSNMGLTKKPNTLSIAYNRDNKGT